MGRIKLRAPGKINWTLDVTTSEKMVIMKLKC